MVPGPVGAVQGVVMGSCLAPRCRHAGPGRAGFVCRTVDVVFLTGFFVDDSREAHPRSLSVVMGSVVWLVSFLPVVVCWTSCADGSFTMYDTSYLRV